MLQENKLGAVTQIMMGHEVDGHVYYWTAAYLLDGLLVDTGCSYTAPELIEYLRDKSAIQVINTHYHEDHVGGNALLQKEFNLDIYAHPLAVSLINKKMELHDYQKMVWGYPEPTTVKPLGDKIETEHYNFRVIETPGHSPDHISLYEPEQNWLFSGDLFVSEDQKVFRADEDIYGIIDSLHKIIKLGTQELILFTAIGKIFPAGKASTKRYLEHLDSIRNEAFNLASKGLSAEEIKNNIFSRESIMDSLTGGHYSIQNLIDKILVR
jgi:glyoxylase-like metal-dependent hydrolase (beta-lactamase superfamily II)